MKDEARAGFTLFELSIVLAILALIISGILVGQDMIRAWEMRKLHKQYESFKTATETFRTKYNCIPGDCEHATQFFPPSPEGCYDFSAQAGDPNPIGYAQEKTACDGDGNGIVDFNPTNFSTTGIEQFGFWQQLADAELIPGTYAGSSSSSTAAGLVTNNNCAPSTSVAHCWAPYSGLMLDAFFGFFGNLTANAHLGNILFILPTSDDYTNARNNGDPYSNFAIFTPAEALSYDGKFDDGHPDSGQIFAEGDNFTSECTTPDQSAAGPFAYDISKTGHNCSPMYRLDF
jgi:prepilin-type N-terminal cleavage/methylation domain-containing protein